MPKFLKNNELENFQTYIDKKLSLTKELEVKVMPTTLIITKGPYELSRVEGYIDWLNKELLFMNLKNYYNFSSNCGKSSNKITN